MGFHSRNSLLIVSTHDSTISTSQISLTLVISFIILFAFNMSFSIMIDY